MGKTRPFNYRKNPNTEDFCIKQIKPFSEQYRFTPWGFDRAE